MEFIIIINNTSEKIEICKFPCQNTISIESYGEHLVSIGTIKACLTGHFDTGSFILLKKCRQYTFQTFGKAVISTNTKDGKMVICIGLKD